MDSAELAPHRGGLILALGILGLVLCQPIGIAAWVMGNSDLARIDAGHMDPTGRGLTQAGKICGIVAVVLMAFCILLCVAGVVVWVLLGAPIE